MAAFLNEVLDFLGLGPERDDWEKRTREEITLIAPDETEFTAGWRGDAHSVVNKVGIHTFPGVTGAKVQDLKAGPEIYNLTLFFTGTDNDLNSTAFMEALKNNEGDWSIEHPTKGPLFMIWTAATENIFPVDSGNVTVVETAWVVNIPDTEKESAAQAQAQAIHQSGISNASAADQFESSAILDTAGKVSAVLNSVGKAFTAAKKVLNIVENAAILDPRLVALEAAITNTLSSGIIDTSALAGQVQAYVQLFGLGQTNAIDSIKMYSDFADEVLLDVPTQATDDGTAQVATTELIANAALIGAAKGALIGGNTSRQQAVSAATNLAAMFNNVTNELDKVQVLYSGNLINNRYISQETGFADQLVSNSLSVRFLFISLFGLPSERTIALREDLFVPQVVFNEYGSLGNGDDDMFFLDLLYESNGLHGDDMWMLDAGRQVLIYQ